MFLVIQGVADADVGGGLTQKEVGKTVDFCLNAFRDTSPEERQKVLDKVQQVNDKTSGKPEAKEELEKLTEDELQILHHIRARQMLRMEDTFNLNHFGSDAIAGFAPNLKRGKLGLVPKSAPDEASKLEAPVVDLLAMVDEPMAQETEPMGQAESDPVGQAQSAPIAAY